MDYMDLTEIAKPDKVLRPRSRAERKIWNEYVEKGWIGGIDQANDIFETNLDQLTADYVGMIRYKKLLAQKMVSEPFAVKENRGVTGGADEIRIDDKAVIITNIPALNRSTYTWEPTER